jgi:hypothetical protein
MSLDTNKIEMTGRCNGKLNAYTAKGQARLEYEIRSSYAGNITKVTVQHRGQDAIDALALFREGRVVKVWGRLKYRRGNRYVIVVRNAVFGSIGGWDCYKPDDWEAKDALYRMMVAEQKPSASSILELGSPFTPETEEEKREDILGDILDSQDELEDYDTMPNPEDASEEVASFKDPMREAAEAMSETDSEPIPFEERE